MAPFSSRDEHAVLAVQSWCLLCTVGSASENSEALLLVESAAKALAGAGNAALIQYRNT